MDLSQFDVQLHASQHGSRIKEALALVEGLPNHQAAAVLLSAACIVVDRMPKENLGSAGLLREDIGRNHADSMMDLGPAAIGAFLARLAVLMPKVNETVIDVEGGPVNEDERKQIVGICGRYTVPSGYDDFTVHQMAQEIHEQIVETERRYKEISNDGRGPFVYFPGDQKKMDDLTGTVCLNPTKGDV